ncbi:hypothetical protein Y1Q_0004529 [Alligator mississippiensis]|uniref:Ig-like domain-containing protein n=2 Tax=Alligator mississippiensis TaxID=8496 RepID=A0A151MAM8_ALLMI|nr:hypothetical protein Y1Q_0004529 [Alligator mississippiensis]
MSRFSAPELGPSRPHGDAGRHPLCPAGPRFRKTWPPQAVAAGKKDSEWVDHKWLSTVGSDFTNSSSVLLLGPGAGENGAMDPAHLACVIRGVSNLVWVSWHVPGEEPAQGLPRLLEASDGSLTLIHDISIPWASWTSGATVTCEVTFNSSGSSVTRHAVYSASPSAPCVMLPVVAVGSALLLVTVPLSLIWIHCPPRWGSRPREAAPHISQENQDGLIYTELAFKPLTPHKPR